MRVLDVPELGYTAAIITIGDEKVLMIDTSMSQEDRVDIMLGAMDQLEEES